MIDIALAEPDDNIRPHIAVIGVGGAGGNALNNMISASLEGCDFIAANTDSQALSISLAQRKIQLGIKLSRGLGAGSKPDIGGAAAEEQADEIRNHIEGFDMLFVTAGMGGGTGTGAAPVIARLSKEAGILTVGVVTKPFHFEGTQRMRQAERGIAELQKYVDTLIVIPNQNLFRIANERTTFAEAFRLADEVLRCGVQGITDLMVMPGFMNLDFADVKTVMGEMGKAMMGTGEAEGENRAIRAAEAAISNPLLDDVSMRGARGVLINITGGLDMTLFEVDQAANRIREEVDMEAQIKVGSTLGEALDGRIRVSIIATGIDAGIPAQINTTQSGGGALSKGGTGGSSAGGGANSGATNVSSKSAVAAQSSAQRAQDLNKLQGGREAVREYGQEYSQDFSTQRTPPPRPVDVRPEPVVINSAADDVTNAAKSYFVMPNPIAPESLADEAGARQSQHNNQNYTTASRSAVQEADYDVDQTGNSESADYSISANISTQRDEVAADTAPRSSFESAPSAVSSGNQHATGNASARLSVPVSASNSMRSSRATVQQSQQPLKPQNSQQQGNNSMRSATAGGNNSSTRASAVSQNSEVKSSVSARSQSLFQRITGFGSNRHEEARTAPVAASAPPKRMLPDIMDDDNTEQLDIPAFLRRQGNS